MAFKTSAARSGDTNAIQSDPYGKDAAVIGQVVNDYPGKVFLKTRIGGKRIVDMLTGEQLPRIC